MGNVLDNVGIKRQCKLAKREGRRGLPIRLPTSSHSSDDSQPILERVVKSVVFGFGMKLRYVRRTPQNQQMDDP
jgi:hypothetical protein